MELALYCPVYGYYEKEGDTIGRRGDYLHQRQRGASFGELLALQFAEWLAQIDTGPGECSCLEAASAENAATRGQPGSRTAQAPAPQDSVCWNRARMTGHWPETS